MLLTFPLLLFSMFSMLEWGSGAANLSITGNFYVFMVCVCGGAAYLSITGVFYVFLFGGGLPTFPHYCYFLYFSCRGVGGC